MSPNNVIFIKQKIFRKSFPLFSFINKFSVLSFFSENNIGKVINIKDEYSAEIESIYLNFKNNLLYKKHCSEYAVKELMWQTKSINIFNTIRNI